MRKLIAAINMTLDGFCDHTAITPDEEIHQHYTDLLQGAGLILYGKTTYQLMQYWQTLLTNPSRDKSMNDFAQAIDRIPKLVFSHTLETTGWNSAQLASQPLEGAVREERQKQGKDILVGSRSLILQLMQLNLVDEYQFCVHPVVAGSGLPLFEKGVQRTVFTHMNTKSFQGGAVLLYYAPAIR